MERDSYLIGRGVVSNHLNRPQRRIADTRRKDCPPGSLRSLAAVIRNL